jgi:hypothetical protein
MITETAGIARRHSIGVSTIKRYRTGLARGLPQEGRFGFGTAERLSLPKKRFKVCNRLLQPAVKRRLGLPPQLLPRKVDIWLPLTWIVLGKRLKFDL